MDGYGIYDVYDVDRSRTAPSDKSFLFGAVEVHVKQEWVHVVIKTQRNRMQPSSCFDKMSIPQIFFANKRAILPEVNTASQRVPTATVITLTHCRSRTENFRLPKIAVSEKRAILSKVRIVRL